MLDQLTQLAQQQTPQALAAVPGIPEGSQQAVAQEASQSIFTGMQQLLHQGGPGALKGLFAGAQSGDANNPQVQQIADQFSGNLAAKTGLQGSIAKSIGAALIPLILGQLFRRTKDPSDSGFNIQDILGSLLGGGGTQAPAGGALGSVLGGMLGGNGHAGPKSSTPLDRDGDGDTDLADLMSMFR